MKTPDALRPLVEEGLIQEVIRPLMSGKEAAVYVVRSADEIRVAKVYKDAQSRSFRQRAQYSEGRQVRNTRQKRAMAKGSKYGKQLLEAAWQSAEVDALYRLHHAGVRVPEPYDFSENVLIMEMITDEKGDPAPRLFDVELSRDQARELHGILIRQTVRILCAGMVHGDLSAYNILITPDGPVIIDLPQATDAAHNNNSRKLLIRDVDHLAHYLGRFDRSLRRTRYGPEMWDLYERGQLFPETKLTGKFKGKTGPVDADAIIREIQAAAEEAGEAGEAPVSAYRAKKDAQREDLAAAAERMKQRREREAREPKPKTKPKPAAERPPGEGKRRRRRRRGGDKGPEPMQTKGQSRGQSKGQSKGRGPDRQPKPATSAPSADAPKKRRRRRRRRPTPGTPSAGPNK